MNFKKVITILILVLLIAVGIAIVVGSNQGRNVFFVTSFNKTIKKTIKAKKNKTYNFQIVKLKGEVNDTIIVIPCKQCKPEKLSGKINIKYKNDFKKGTARMIFKPYKATEGNLKIVHKIR